MFAYEENPIRGGGRGRLSSLFVCVVCVRLRVRSRVCVCVCVMRQHTSRRQEEDVMQNYTHTYTRNAVVHCVCLVKG